jgi:3-(3-hydroxy-phenyl)propionate hydroxylase
MPQQATVVVIGAGPTGVTAATLLGQAGIDCLLLDRWSEVFAQPRAVHLDDEVYRVLGRLGVAEAFAAVSRPSLGLRLLDPSHRVLAEFSRSPDRSRHGHPQANMFDQPVLESILRDNLRKISAVTFRGDVEVVDVTQSASGVRVDFEDRTTGERSVVHAEYVLGCDGANSLVRPSMGATMNDLGFEQRWLVVDIDTDADLGAWGGVHQVCDTERAATYMQVGERRHRWEFRLAPDEDAAGVGSPDSLARLVAPWTKSVPFEQLELIRTAEYTFRAQVADRWRDRRLFLLGDAAHLTPPFIGQGMGAGIRDAANLSWKLVSVLRRQLPESVLDSYQAERKPHAQLLIRRAMLVGRAMTAGGDLGQALRKVIAPALRLLPGVRNRLMDSQSPRLRRSALIDRGLLPGSLCPNALLDGGRRLDALDGWVLVTTGRPGQALEQSLSDRGVGMVRVPAASALGRWLRRGLVSYALVRPDGTVMKAGRRVARLSLAPISAAGNSARDGAPVTSSRT